MEADLQTTEKKEEKMMIRSDNSILRPATLGVVVAATLAFGAVAAFGAGQNPDEQLAERAIIGDLLVGIARGQKLTYRFCGRLGQRLWRRGAARQRVGREGRGSCQLQLRSAST